MQTIGERIKYVRQEKGLNQTQLGEIIDLGAGHVSVKEREYGQVFTPSQLTKLGEHFNINMNWLFFGNGRVFRN